MHKQTKRTTTRWMAAAAVGLAVGLAMHVKAADSSDVSRPHVILCMADDLGWGDTGYNGHPVLRTPHLDRMAREGIRFDRFYAAAPVCSPTRGSCLTGRHPYRYGITFANVGCMEQEELTLAEVLKTQGYATGHFGKWHLGTLTTKLRDANRGQPGDAAHFAPPWMHGFDVCFSTESKVPTYNPMVCPRDFKNHPGNLQRWWDPEIAPGNATRYGTRYWNEKGDEVTEHLDGDDSRLIMDRAIPFIQQAVRDRKPFFAVIWFHAPHLPVAAGREYYDLYEGQDDYTRHYLGCITALDEQLGRLRQTLKEFGADENTMLWFCSDNGPEGNPSAPGKTRGLRGRKRSLYEGGVRVPGLLVWPQRIKQHRVVSMPCSTSDYFPTVLDALGYLLPEARTRSYDGVSLMPLIRGELEARPRPIGFESQKQVSLSDNRFKIYSGNGGKTFELYDLVDDPGESRNLSAEHPEIVERMRRTLETWRESCRQESP